MASNYLGFSFVIQDVLAGMSKPGRFNEPDSDLEFLRAQRIGAILSLTEEALDKHLVQARGFSYLHVPVVDFTAPSMEQIHACVSFIDKMRAEKKSVAVHCHAGLGRTGTILACYLVATGMDAMEAVKLVRARRPLSVQTEGQLFAVFLYEQALKDAQAS